MGCLHSILNKKKYSRYKKINVNSKNNIYKTINNFNYKTYICKKIRNKRRLLKEVEIIKLLESDKTIILESYNIISNYGYIYYEYIPGLDFYEFIKSKYFKREYSFLRVIFKQMISCIEHCHNNNIVHLDIKLENFICVNNDHNFIKLIDFEFSKKNNNKNNNITHICGSIPYIPPEIFKYRYSFKSDIWSLACLFYALLFLEDIFPKKKFIDMILDLKNSKYFENLKNKLNNELPKDISNMLLNMLVINPNKRLSINELSNILK